MRIYRKNRENLTAVQKEFERKTFTGYLTFELDLKKPWAERVSLNHAKYTNGKKAKKN